MVPGTLVYTNPDGAGSFHTTRVIFSKFIGIEWIFSSGRLRVEIHLVPVSSGPFMLAFQISLLASRHPPDVLVHTLLLYSGEREPLTLHIKLEFVIFHLLLHLTGGLHFHHSVLTPVLIPLGVVVDT